MFCTGEFSDNHYTIEGTGLHQRVHTVGEGNREETWQIRAIWLKSESYKLIGKADLIEAIDGKWYPVQGATIIARTKPDKGLGGTHPWGNSDAD